MSAWKLLALVALTSACHPDDSAQAKHTGDSAPDDSTPPDTGSSDTADTQDTGDTAETAETGETQETDTGETEPPWEPGGDAVMTLADSGVVKLIGEGTWDAMSYFLALDFAGDIDGDGFDDVLVGFEEANWEEGTGFAGIARGPLTTDLTMSSADVRMTGPEGSSFGYSVAGVGDVDGDGFDDVLIGAPFLDDGFAYLFRGPLAGDIGTDEAYATLIGESGETSRVRMAVAGAGDVNGDGFADLLVGGPEYLAYAGCAYLVLGPVSGDVDLATDSALPLHGSGIERIGYDVASAGDTNGDGLDDVLIGAPTDPEVAAYQFNGPVDAALTPDDADTRFLDMKDENDGLVIDSAEDTDGDGYDDVVVSKGMYVLYGTALGGAYVIAGPTAGDFDLEDASAGIVGRTEKEGAGASVAGAGDLDGDGFADILVGAPGRGYNPVNGTGTTWVLRGPLSGTLSIDDAWLAIRGDGGSDQSGAVLAGGGDVDGDGIPDIFIGGPTDDDAGEDVGAAWLVYGSLLPAP